MKKQALLAVSALSLGVVGLATFTPVVSADTISTLSKSQVITLEVTGSLGIGSSTDGTGNLSVISEQLGGNAATASNDTDTVATVYTTNNTGKTGTVTLKDSDTTTALTEWDDTANEGKGDYVSSSPATIPTNATIKAGTSAWGVATKWDTTNSKALESYGSYQAMPSSEGAAIVVGQDKAADTTSPSSTGTFNVKYGFSTSATQKAAIYRDTVTYSYTAAD